MRSGHRGVISLFISLDAAGFSIPHPLDRLGAGCLSRVT